MNDELNQAYTERTIAAVLAAKMALAAGFAAGVAKHEGHPEPNPEWQVTLRIDFPGGQVSWHIAPQDQHLLKGLPRYEKPWEGTSESRTGVRIKSLPAPAFPPGPESIWGRSLGWVKPSSKSASPSARPRAKT